MSTQNTELSDERILHLWDTHVAYETGYKGAHLGNKDKLAFARAVLASAPTAPQEGAKPVAFVSAKDLEALRSGNWAFATATAFPVPGHVPLYTHPLPDQEAMRGAAQEAIAAMRDVIGWVPGNWHTDAPKKSVERVRAAIASLEAAVKEKSNEA